MRTSPLAAAAQPLLLLLLMLLVTSADAFVLHRAPRPAPDAAGAHSLGGGARRVRLRLAQEFHAGAAVTADGGARAQSSSDDSGGGGGGVWRDPEYSARLAALQAPSRFLARPSDTFLRVRDLTQNAEAFENSRVYEVDAVPGAVPGWSQWTQSADIFEKDMLLPNASDPLTVRVLAQMTSNSYSEPGGSGWVDIPPYNLSDRFGWQSDGIRGYVFVDDTKDLLVIALKGTSLSVPIVGGGPTAPRDKFNDNLMFSCCCGKVSSSWSPVCECADSSTSTCDMTCLHSAASFSNSYFNLANTIYSAVSLWYPPSSTIWLTGHSLGGALASLVGLTHDLPVFAYEAPGDFLYASRIGLIPDLPPSSNDSSTHSPPPPPRRREGKARDASAPASNRGHHQNAFLLGDAAAAAADAAASANPTHRIISDYESFLETLEIYHFGNLKDPIYVGECISGTSLCWLVAYALETKCHSGKMCVYDQLGSDLDMRYHSIDRVITEILNVADHVPECKVHGDCRECEGWTWKSD
ncbi:putative lipase atg15 [Entophlyctis sp. JEL0112]|nr:putative lipase atg15 [Entophlyctis sp. JEL0112]